MKIKRILAGGLAALMAGATLAFGAFAATTLQDFVTVSDSTLSSPVIVVGDTKAGALSTAATAVAKAEDTIAAADVAAALAGYATKTGTCAATGEDMTVSGGTGISTANKKLYLGDGLNKALSTLTKSHLPTLLASSSLTVSGTTYTYDQYIDLGTSTLEFGKSGEAIDPILYVNMGTSTTTPVYTATIVFNKPLNISDTSNVQGKTIDLFGSTYTIASGSGATNEGYNPLVLFGAGITKTLDEDVPMTVNIGGTDYTVEANYIASASVLIKVNEETSSALAEGASDVVGGLNLYVKDILYSSKTGSVSKAIISLGTEKITLQTTKKAKLGQDLTSVDNTLVTITGSSTGISKLQVAVAAQKTSEDHLDVGTTYTDPVFKTFKVGFGGIIPTTDSATRSTLEIAPSGTYGAQLTMTDFRGNEASIMFAYDNDSVSGVSTPILGDASSYMIHVLENEVVKENEYVVLSASTEFSHLYKMTNIDDLGETTASVELTDQFSDDVITISLDAGAYSNGTFYVDGQTYYIETINTTSSAGYKAYFTWGNSASYGIPGDETTIFPVIKDKNGALVAFVGNQSTTPALSNATVYQVPGGSAGVSNITVRDDDADGAFAAGRLSYNFNTGSTTLNNISGAVITGFPAVIVLEEKGEDTSDTDQRDAVIISTTTTGTSPVKMAVSSTIVFTAGTKYEDNNRVVTNTYLYDEIDRYGTYVTSDSYEQGKVTITYPDTQATATVGFGDDPKFSTSAAEAGSTYNEAVPITNAVAKFASEIAATPTSDLILIGGPCVNTLVAQLLEISTASGDCYNEFVAAYPTKGVVKVVEDAFVTGKKALIIAGTNAANTRDLADNYAIKGDLDEAA